MFWNDFDWDEFSNTFFGTPLIIVMLSMAFLVFLVIANLLPQGSVTPIIVPTTSLALILLSFEVCFRTADRNCKYIIDSRFNFISLIVWPLVAFALLKSYEYTGNYEHPLLIMPAVSFLFISLRWHFFLKFRIWFANILTKTKVAISKERAKIQEERFELQREILENKEKDGRVSLVE